MDQNHEKSLDQNLLQDYYQALEAINTQHLKRVEAKRELEWHNSRKEEAYQLLKKFRDHDILSLPKSNNDHTVTNRKRVEKYFKISSRLANEYIKLVKDNQKNKSDKYQEIKNLKAQKDNQLKETQKEHKSILDKLNKEQEEAVKLSQQANRNLDSLKTKKMLYFLSVVVFAVVTAFLLVQTPMKPSGHFFYTAIFVSLYFIIIFTDKNLNPLKIKNLYFLSVVVLPFSQPF